MITIYDMIHSIAQRFQQADLFYGHGTDNPEDEALALVFYVLNLSYDQDASILEHEVSKLDQKRIEQLCDFRIETRKPLPYITHEAYFCGFKFYVDERVIVPRSPFAELIQNQFEPWVNPGEVSHILDLCTGSGCIAIACAHYFEQAEVDAIDLSPDALDVAKINVQKHHLADRVHLIQSDLFDAVSSRKYDLIVSNPPYVSSDEMKMIPQEFLHEPNMALEAEDEGLFIVDRILKQAKAHLQPSGVLIVEVGNAQAALEKRYPDLPFVWLEFEHGGAGVFLLTYDDLIAVSI